MSKSEERRAQAAAARQATQVAEKRERTIRLVGTGVIVVVVAAIIGIGVMGSRSDNAPSEEGSIPAAVDQETGAWTLNPSTTATAVMDVYEDFQCPGCRNFEAAYAETYKKLADENVVKVLIHPAAFLDQRFTGENSARAISAWGCAIDAGKGWEFHRDLYAAQPEQEGKGWTDAEFGVVAKTAGITGDKLATFQKCVADRSYMKWASLGTKKFSEDGIESTPTVKVNGVQATDADFASVEAFTKFVKDNAAK